MSQFSVEKVYLNLCCPFVSVCMLLLDFAHLILEFNENKIINALHRLLSPSMRHQLAEVHRQ